MRRIKVLIVDDDARFTHVAKATLEKTGKYEVTENSDGLGTLEAARELKPDLILRTSRCRKPAAPSWPKP